MTRELVDFSLEVRRQALTSIFHAGSGHPGGSLSSVDVLVALFTRYGSRRQKNGDVDGSVILSKGHACPALYAVGSVLGVISKGDITRLRKLGSALQGHPHVGCVPWVETSTGSLGQGFSVAIGMAMGFRHQGDPSRVYVMLGDGELQEGEVWEGAMCASHYKLDNLCAIVDYNKLQSDDYIENIMGLEPLRAKWEAFNWNVLEIDGHNFEQIEHAFVTAKESKGRPTVIVAHTIKGKGVSFMEGVPTWHGSVKLRPEELEQALRELSTAEEDIPAYLDGSIWSRQ